MALTTFSGPIRSLGGFIGAGPDQSVFVADGTNTLTLDVLNYAGKVVVTEDATLVITLPAVNSVDNSTPSSPNNIGATFRIAIKTTATAVAIKTNGTDKFTGSVLMIDTDSSGAVYGYAPASTNDVINLNGTTTGGLSGSFVDVTVVGPGFYFVSGVLLGSSTVATPFADA